MTDARMKMGFQFLRMKIWTFLSLVFWTGSLFYISGLTAAHHTRGEDFLLLPFHYILYMAYRLHRYVDLIVVDYQQQWESFSTLVQRTLIPLASQIAKQQYNKKSFFLFELIFIRQIECLMPSNVDTLPAIVVTQECLHRNIYSFQLYSNTTKASSLHIQDGHPPLKKK